ncbi:adenosylmethionine--8-amino-7-oxononanoate transaminase [Gammaproteobacteria bacterium]|nr:adenosylmethionine--8-amino-7-oxononanoate transaminase [Gammaproteobacteria bacterium]
MDKKQTLVQKRSYGQWLERDLQVNWHPCMPAKRFEQQKPWLIKSAKGVWLEGHDGQKVLDAISSWWCQSLGHGHEVVQSAISDQLSQFSHVIFANTTHPNIIELSERLTQKTNQQLSHVSFASDGSSAVEMAVKMAIHAQRLKGQSQRTSLAALENAYHGETILTLALSDCEEYRKPYDDLLPKVHRIRSIPYQSDIQSDPIAGWWQPIKQSLDRQKDELAAIIVEPVLQGAGGMKLYHPSVLQKLRAWCDQHQVYLIFDEIMTGFGRTGKFFAYEYASDVQPDFMCLAKGLTSGTLPLSVMLTRQSIYDLFYGDHPDQAFLHSHTHSGNALAVAVALAVIKYMDQAHVLDQVMTVQKLLKRALNQLSEKWESQLTNQRVLGAMAAFDINCPAGSELAFKIGLQARNLGLLIRPLGSTIYLMPPFCITSSEIDQMMDLLDQSLSSVL